MQNYENINNMRKIFTQELHKKIVRNFRRRPALAFYNDDIWSADLMDMSKLATKNNNITWLFVVIDNFSRYLWVFPMKDKNSETVLTIFKRLTKNKAPKNLWTDEGSEFYNKNFQDYCEAKNINHYHTYSGLKAVYAERVNRTMREKTTAYMDENKTEKYIKALPQIVKEYNHTEHSSTKETPAEVYNEDAEVELRQYINDEDKPKFKIGDYVRFSKVKRTFEAGWTPKWTEEVYKIIAIDERQSPLMYELEDLKQEEITGKFYENELLKTAIPNFKEYDKVVSTRKVGRATEYLVHWKGWDNKFNEWVSYARLKELKPNYQAPRATDKEFEKVVETRTVNQKKQYLVKYKNKPATANEWVSFIQLKELKIKK